MEDDELFTGGARGALADLCRLLGVQPSYEAAGTVHRAPEGSVRHALRELGADLPEGGDEVEALRRLRVGRWSDLVEPVTVSWSGDAAEIPVRVPLDRVRQDVVLEMVDEEGWEREFRVPAEQVTWDDEARLEGGAWRRGRVPLPRVPSEGYHEVTVRIGELSGRTRLIRAPRTTWDGAGEGDGKENRAGDGEGDGTHGSGADGSWHTWGTFLPLYALRTTRDWGVGDLTDLGALARWTRQRGGSTVGTLPLLAAFLGGGAGGGPDGGSAGDGQGRGSAEGGPAGGGGADGSPAAGPFEPSPYAPVSRLFWNEAYLDVERAPGLEDAPDARAALASPELRQEVERLRGLDRVDWRAVMAAKRSVLEPLARATNATATGAGGPSFRDFLERRPGALDYARFRARVEETGTSWHTWSGAPGQGTLREEDADPARVRYHLFVQWAMDRQVRELAERERLYLDLPLGCHPDGYDVWRHREQFALGASGGAPPDAFFAGGQDWGFPPLHPWRSRERGHAYLIASLRHLMSACGTLRLDHVMSLHRLFWVPSGGTPGDGVYVRYPHEELWAILCLESRRHRVEIVGEDLGTVPPEVPAAMDRHGARRMWVLPFEVGPVTSAATGAGKGDGDGDAMADRDGGTTADGDGQATADRDGDAAAAAPSARYGEPPPRSVASLNTHDMPPFASYWKGGDIRRRIEGGHLDPAEAQQEEDERRAWREAVASLLRDRVGRGGLLTGTGHGNDPAPADAPDPLASVLSAALEAVAASPARLVLVNLEDLWLEEEPQNEPGTTGPGNWTHRARLTLEEMREEPRVRELLDRVDAARSKTRRPTEG